MDIREASLKRRMTLLAAKAAFVSFVYFLLALAAMHLLRPDYTPVDHMISDYGVGRFSWVMTSAFVAASVGCLMLGIGMLLGGPASWFGRVGAALLFVVSAGLIVTALFPTDLETAPSTRAGTIHALSFLVNVVGITVSSLCLAASYGRCRRWCRRRNAALALTTLMTGALVAQILTLHRGAPYGLVNRAFVALLMAWFLSNSLWLKAAATEDVGLDRPGSPRLR